MFFSTKKSTLVGDGVIVHKIANTVFGGTVKKNRLGVMSSKTLCIFTSIDKGLPLIT